MADAAATAFQLTYQISPIILSGQGVVAGIPGGMLPIISLSQSPFFAGLLGGSALDSLDNYMLQFMPLPGSTLIEQKIGMYPFANQQVAANAVIRDPLTISMLMIVTARVGTGGYATKSATMQAMQATLAAHNNAGGTYTIMTPAFIYTNTVMLAMRDVSRNDSHQPQNAYQLDFIQPLISLQAALNAQSQLNSSMSQINNGVPTSGATSGVDPSVGEPGTLATPSVSPGSSNLGGTNTVGTGGMTGGEYLQGSGGGFTQIGDPTDPNSSNFKEN